MVRCSARTNSTREAPRTIAAAGAPGPDAADFRWSGARIFPWTIYPGAPGAYGRFGYDACHGRRFFIRVIGAQPPKARQRSAAHDRYRAAVADGLRRRGARSAALSVLVR
jgi:hypothetical protein